MADTILGNIASLQTLAVGSSAISEIDFLGDTDWWRVSLQSGFQYQIWVEGASSNRGTLFDPYLAIYGPTGSFIGSSDDYSPSTRDAFLTLNPGTSGTFFLSAESFANFGTGSYQITLWRDELGSNQSAAVLPMNESVSGHVGWLNDTSDWFGVSLTAGVTYEFDLIGPAGDGALLGLTLADPWLALHDSNGLVLATDNDSGMGANARIFFTPSFSGTYYLDVEESGLDASGTYRLIANAAPNSGGLSVGQTISGLIEFPGDVDRYAINLKAGTVYVFSAGGAGNLGVDTFIELQNASGSTLAFDDDGGPGLDSSLSFTPDSDGIYYVAVRQSAISTIIGTYALSATSVAPSILSTSGTAATGSISFVGEKDLFSVSLTAGVTYTFSLQGSDTGAGTLSDPQLSLLTAAGIAITSSDDEGIGRNSIITYTPSSSGTYLLSAEASGSALGTYRLLTLPNDTQPSTSAAPLTSDNIVNAMTSEYSWILGPTRTITWALTDSHGWNWLQPQQRVDQIAKIFDSIAAVANVKFEYAGYFTGSDGPQRAGQAGVDITIAWDDAYFDVNHPEVLANARYPNIAYSYEYSTAIGDIYLNPLSEAKDYTFDPGSSGFQTILHEIGHSLGLKHPHHDSNTTRPTFEQAGVPASLNVDWATVMSYFDDFPSNHALYDPATPMVLDVIALQYLYGANTLTNAGNTTYTLLANSMYQTIWDASGNDTVDATGSSIGWNINLATDVRSAGKAIPAIDVNSISPTTLYWLMGGIENVNGSNQDDTIRGDSSANQLLGLGGNDTLDGGGGDDRLEGGAGSDSLVGGLGNDIMIGGAGNDGYVVDSAGDIVVEQAGEGTDSVVASVSFYMPDNVESLTLAAGSGDTTGSGNSLDNAIVGNDGNNILLGQGGDDILFGAGGNDILAGGSGNDTLVGGTGANELIGGLGDDLFIVTAASPFEAALQTLYEAPGEGIDEVDVSASVFSLEWYGSSELENLLVTDSASHAAIIGNAFNNRITGGTGADTLFGRAGNDTLIGGSGVANTLIGNEGDDTYVVSAIGDSVIEFANQGDDTVLTTLGSFTLRANVENLTFTGSGNFTGIGSSDANRMQGGAGDDFLSGLDGADVLSGGSGSDTLLGGNGADQFRFRASDSGLDRILDFTPGVDQLVLSGFTHTPLFGLVQTSIPARMGNGSTFLYDSSTGIVSFDADGVGSAVAVNIAQLNAGLTLTISDFMFDDTVQDRAGGMVGALNTDLQNDPSGSEAGGGVASGPDPITTSDPLPASTGARPEPTEDGVAPHSSAILDLVKLDLAAIWLYVGAASDGALVARIDGLSDARPDRPSSADDVSLPHAAADDIHFGDAIGLVGIASASAAWHEIPLAHGMF